MELDGRPLDDSTIRLTDDGAKHRVTVRLAPSSVPSSTGEEALKNEVIR
jgi:hypothetical protein